MLSVRTSELDEKLIKMYASDHGETVSEFLRRVAFSEIESEYDKLVTEYFSSGYGEELINMEQEK